MTERTPGTAVRPSADVAPELHEPGDREATDGE
jgi:hypothetical protein